MTIFFNLSLINLLGFVLNSCYILFFSIKFGITLVE